MRGAVSSISQTWLLCEQRLTHLCMSLGHSSVVHFQACSVAGSMQEREREIEGCQLSLALLHISLAQTIPVPGVACGTGGVAAALLKGLCSCANLDIVGCFGSTSTEGCTLDLLSLAARQSLQAYYRFACLHSCAWAALHLMECLVRSSDLGRWAGGMTSCLSCEVGCWVLVGCCWVVITGMLLG
jgi:hypothetical protein